MTQSVQIIFRRSSNPGSALLRFVLWSAWSHVALVDGAEVIEAAAFHGVRATSLEAFKAAGTKWQIIEVPVADAQAVIAAARAKIGLPYDWLGLLGFVTHSRSAKDAGYFCSALVAYAFAAVGAPLFNDEAYRITPRDLAIRTY